jgi:hypothetical protein
MVQELCKRVIHPIVQTLMLISNTKSYFTKALLLKLVPERNVSDRPYSYPTDDMHTHHLLFILSSSMVLQLMDIKWLGADAAARHSRPKLNGL